MRRTCHSPFSCASGRAGHLQDLLGATGRENDMEPSSFLELSSPLISVKSLYWEMGTLVAVAWQRAHRWRPGVMKVLPKLQVRDLLFEET